MLEAFKDMTKVSPDTFANDTHLLKVVDNKHSEHLKSFEEVMTTLSNKTPELKINFLKFDKVGLMYKGDFKKHIKV